MTMYLQTYDLKLTDDYQHDQGECNSPLRILNGLRLTDLRLTDLRLTGLRLTDLQT